MLCKRTVLVLALLTLGGLLQRTRLAAQDVGPESVLRAEDATRPSLKSAGPRWWKGNLHTHSLWSDGQEFPEVIVDWYKGNGYHFLPLSDHNVLSAGRLYIAVGEQTETHYPDFETNVVSRETFARYLQCFGPDWVERRQSEERHLVRLKSLSEFRHRFEEPNRFMLIQSEEITDKFELAGVHVNATNILEPIPPQGGAGVVEVMQNNIDAVLEQRERTGRPMFPHLNHPNMGWSITAENILEVRGERFF